MKLRHTLPAVIAVLIGVPLRAEEPDSVTVPAIVTQLGAGTVQVELPQGFIDRLSPRADDEAEESDPADKPKARVSRNGFRVQIFDDNNARTAKHEAQARRSMVGARFPEFRTYVSFNSPYWRVKVGDFATHSEAEAAMGAIRQAFPHLGGQLRIVRDRINP